jgi:hypothetical protein
MLIITGTRDCFVRREFSADNAMATSRAQLRLVFDELRLLP